MNAKTEMKTVDALVVGGGIAGLTASAFLAKAGTNVLLCEMGQKCGGLVGSFERDGFTFDGGIRAMEDAGVLFPMLRQLGIQMDFVPSPVSMGIEDQILRFESEDSLDDYGTLLKRLYPESEAAINAILDEIRTVMRHMDVQYGIDNPLFLDPKKDREYFMREVLPWMFRYAGTVRKIMAMRTPVAEFLRGYTDNQQLIDIMAQHFFTATPAYFALSYLKIHLDYHYPASGATGAVPDALVDFITARGGEIHTGTKVISVNPADNYVQTESGESIHYRQLIWAADTNALYQALEGEKLPNARTRQRVQHTREDLRGLRGNNSIFTLYLQVDLDKSYFADIHSAHFFYTPSRVGQGDIGPAPVGKSKSKMKKWLDKYYALTTYEISIPALRDSHLAPPGKTGLIVSTLFDYSLMKQMREEGWEDEIREYIEYLMLCNLDRTVYPGIVAKVNGGISSTPLTIEKRVGTTEGAITGWSFTNARMPAEERLARIANAVNTPIPGVLQAGQWTFSPSGFPIAMITGKLAADKALKRIRRSR